jgi:4-alpha-glucanotransferase
VTSLPSPFGVGDLGPHAYRWVDFLAHARQRYWQVLPLGPPAARGENSPYRAASAFAGNPLLISPALLIEEGWLDAGDVAVPPDAPAGRVDYAAAARAKHALLERAYTRFAAGGNHAEFDAFRAARAAWLRPFAVFRALASRHPGRPWWEWPEPDRACGACVSVPAGLEDAVRREEFIQFLFERQWTRLRAYANECGVRIFGDVPFYVDGESADVWSRPDLFKLDEAGRARVVAGVPPDDFSATGQLWGNPVYAWAAHARDGYAWWVARIRRSFELFDVVRLDHFRGFSAHWEVPAASATAAPGAWVDGPGKALLDAVAAAVPGSSLVAEDLGTITPGVRELIRAGGLPGMKVLLFAFDGDTASNPHAPHHHVPDAVVYTGTHDNNTARGWFERDASPTVRAQLARYLGREYAASEVSAALVRLAMMSVCRIAILPMQDLLGLGADARMNRPSTPNGNWEWRLAPGQLTPELANHLGELTEAYGRT